MGSSLISIEGFIKTLEFWPMFMRGTLYTILLALFAVFFGCILATFLSFMRMSNIKILKFISSVYIEFVRGTPLLVQLYIIYYGLFSVIDVPSIIIFGYIDTGRFIPGVVAIAFNSGGYLAEIMRAGIMGVDYGQTEAARSLGLTKGKTMRFVVMPQAVKNILPPVANEFVTIIKESSVVSFLGMAEIMFTANAIKGSAYVILEPLIIASLIYMCLTFPASKGIQALERRMRRGDQR